ncbi:MAG: LptF/LptG family permease [Myxococcota bacterium]
MRILSRYFLASYLTLFVSILVSATVAITVIEMMLNFDDILDRHEGLAGVATYLFLRIPAYYLRDLLPITSFAAVFFALGLPARAHEITAIKSGGISPQWTVVPLLGAAALLSVVTLGVNESIVLGATREWNQLRNPGGEISFRQGSFWYHRGDSIYNVQNADPQTRILHGVSVFELGPTGRLLKSVRSQRVEVSEGNRWRFHDAIERTFDPSRPAAPPQTERLRTLDRAVASERDLALLDKSAKTLSLLNLRDYISAQIRDGRDSHRYQAQFHARLAEPVTVLLFALLAIPLGLAVERTQSLATSALVGIVLIGVFYTFRTAVDVFAASGVTSAIVGPWMIMVAFFGYGALQLMRVPR